MTAVKIPSPVAKRKARIEIIPLIDIVFFLLATFVMVSLSMVKNQGISVNLPKATTASAQDTSAYATVSLSADGDLYLNKEKVSLGIMKNKLEAQKSSGSELRVMVQADTDADFGAAVSVMDEIRRLGITKIAIQTKGVANK